MSLGVPYGTAVQELFWAKVDRRGPDECWPWTAGIGSHGRGNFYGLGPGRQETSHRMALILTEGSPPEGKPHALHSCDNPPCCNPAHLRWGTHAENMQDKVERGRAAPGRSNLESCTNGGHPLTGDNVRIKIKTDAKTGKVYTTRNCRQCQRETQRARRAQKGK